MIQPAYPQGRLTAAGFIGLFLHGIIVAMPGAFLRQWSYTFGASLNISLFYTLFLLSSLAGLVWVSRHKHRHPIFTLAFATIGVAFMIMACAPVFGWMGGAALLLGWGDGILNFHCNNLVGELHPRRKIVILNWANATFGIGALSAPLINAALPWRWAFGLVAMAAILTSALAWQAPSVRHFQPHQDRVRWSIAWPFLWVILIYVGLESAIGTWSGPYLSSMGWSEAWQTGLLAAYWGGLTVGRLLLGVWVSPFPIRRLQRLLLLGGVTLTLTSFPSFGFLFPMAAVLYGPTFATIFALLQEQCGHIALGYMFYAAYLGKALFPSALDQIPNALDLRFGFLGLAVLLFLSSLLLQKHPKQIQS